MRTSAVFLVVFAGLATSVVFGQSARQGLLGVRESAAVDAAVEQEMKRQKVVGVALGIIRDGHVAYTKGYGFEDRRLFSEASETTMWTPQSTADGQPTKLGLGFFCQTVDGTLQIAHNGSQEKTKTRLVIYPRKRQGMVVMSNSENANPGQFVAAVYQALSNK
jgi:hypothetical protein